MLHSLNRWILIQLWWKSHSLAKMVHSESNSCHRNSWNFPTFTWHLSPSHEDAAKPAVGLSLQTDTLPIFGQAGSYFLWIKIPFSSHEKETTSPWQRNYLIKTLQQLFSHISHYCPVLPQLAFVSKMALLWMFLVFGGFFSSFCPLSTDLIRMKIGKTSYSQSRNLCCVMWIPGFSLWMQKNLTYRLKNVRIYL